MMRVSWIIRGSLLALAVLSMGGLLGRSPLGAAPAMAQGTLLVDGGFDANKSNFDLRDLEKGQGWFESRKDGILGPKLLKLSKKKIGGNATYKAMIKGNPKKNTYLTQAFNAPQKGSFTVNYDIYVKEVLPTPNRSAIQMIGNAAEKAPNATGAQRFVFLAFENATAGGKVNLIAYEGGSKDTASKKRVVVPDLDLKKWYTVQLNVNVPGKSYTVNIPGVTPSPVTVKAFDATGKGSPKELTHISFASWNDGPGTFYVDNVQ